MEQIVELTTLGFFLPQSFQNLLEKYSLFRQNMYNKFCNFILLKYPFNILLKLCHRFLFSFRFLSLSFGAFIEKYISLNMFALIISIIMSRVHLAGYLIIFCLLFIRLEGAVLNMLRFYKKYPEQLNILYHKRTMWTNTAKIIQEASTNPQVQAISVAVTGALAWKCLDVYDTIKAQAIADADRLAVQATADADRLAENNRHVNEINMRQAELEEARLARQDENSRHAEDLALRREELAQTQNKN